MLLANRIFALVCDLILIKFNKKAGKLRRQEEDLKTFFDLEYIIISKKKIISNVVIQAKFHRLFGGIV